MAISDMKTAVQNSIQQLMQLYFPGPVYKTAAQYSIEHLAWHIRAMHRSATWVVNVMVDEWETANAHEPGDIFKHSVENMAQKMHYDLLQNWDGVTAAVGGAVMATPDQWELEPDSVLDEAIKAAAYLAGAKIMGRIAHGLGHDDDVMWAVVWPKKRVLPFSRKGTEHWDLRHWQQFIASSVPGPEHDIISC